MQDKDLELLLKDIESDRVERKSRLGETDRIGEAICAFANDMPNHRLPGVLFIGVHDDGSSANLDITDDLLKRLAHIRDSGNILPLPVMTVQKKIINNCPVAVVTVAPSDAPPVRFKGVVWTRVGPRRARASAEDERILIEKRRGKDLPYDLHPVESAELSDLDMDLFERGYLPAAQSPEILEQNKRKPFDQLVSLRFATPGSKPVPTVLGVLVVGTEPLNFIPGSYVQFLRIDGMDLTDPIRDQKKIDGPIDELIRMMEETFLVHVCVASDFASGTLEVRHPDYPIAALRQLARNAIMHRNYEGTNAPVRITWFNDRIEILSPGGPFGQVTRRNFGKAGLTDYRNPHLAEAMKNLGYVQRFGVGIHLAATELERNGNPPPEFEVEDTHVCVIIRRIK